MSMGVFGVSLSALGLLIIVAGASRFRYADRRIRARGALVAAFGGALQTVAGVLMEEMATASFSAAVTAFALWMWWNNGGGDGVRAA